MQRPLKLAISITIPILVWLISSLFTINSISDWYTTLEKPSFNPPNWIFWPAWTILYILMWISFFLIWRKKYAKHKKRLFTIYFTQLFFNFTWSIVFFYLESPFLWLINILILLVLIVYNIKIFSKTSKLSWILLVPYLLWVTFATILNFSIFILN